MPNTPPGTYILNDDQGNNVGAVTVGSDDTWTYLGKDGGRNSGTTMQPRPDQTVFTDDSGNQVAVRGQDGHVNYADPATGDRKVGTLQPFQ